MATTLGTFIRQRRQDLGLTQEQLAEAIGDHVNQSDISRLERDRITLPRRERLEQLAAALDVSLGDLLARTGWLKAGDSMDQVLDREATAQPASSIPPAPLAPDDVQALAHVIETTRDRVANAQDSLATAEEALDLTLAALTESAEQGHSHAAAGPPNEQASAQVWTA